MKLSTSADADVMQIDGSSTRISRFELERLGINLARMSGSIHCWYCKSGRIDVVDPDDTECQSTIHADGWGYMHCRQCGRKTMVEVKRFVNVF